MLEIDAALKRYDELTQKGRDALIKDYKYKKDGNVICWFDTMEFLEDLQHFLDEALSEDKSYLYGEDFCTGAKVKFEEKI